MNHNVFISYSSKDKQIADAICHTIEQYRIACWIAPRDVIPGAPYAKEIINGIKNCRIMVLIYSEYANASEHVCNEIDWAFHEGKIIIPFLVDNTPMNEEINYYLRRKHWLIAYPNYEEKFYSLVETIAGLLQIRIEPNSFQKEQTNTIQIRRSTNNENQDDLRIEKILTDPTLSELEISLCYMESGTFTRGDIWGDGFEDERPLHEVFLSGYFIGRYPVTQSLWKKVMNTNPSFFKGDDHPVEQVNWYDTQEFIKRLNAMTGYMFSLPTEAQWEFAARGGIHSKGYKYSGSDDLNLVAWYDKNEKEQTRPVGQKKENEIGLFDMNGNVWEWCQDWKGPYSDTLQINPQGPSSGEEKVCKGGSWGRNNQRCRISYRGDDKPNLIYYTLGFRLVLNMDQE